MDISNFFGISRYKWSLFGMKNFNGGKFIRFYETISLIKNVESEINKAQSEINELKEENERLLKIVNDKALELLTNDERDRLVLKSYGEDYDKITKATIWIDKSHITTVDITKSL